MGHGRREGVPAGAQIPHDDEPSVRGDDLAQIHVRLEGRTILKQFHNPFVLWPMHDLYFYAIGRHPRCFYEHLFCPKR